MSGTITFQIYAQDDLGIDSAKIIIYDQVGISTEGVSSGKIIPDTSNIRKVLEDAMEKGTTTTQGTEYQYNWDSTTQPDNFYLIEFRVADIDNPQHVVTEYLLIQTDNVSAPPPSVGTAGFEIPLVLLGLLLPVAYVIKRKRPF